MIEIIDCEQGSPAWFQARLGLPTASNFSAILAKGDGKTRKSYMNKLAAEIVTGEMGEQFTSQVLERGKAMEAEARDLYAFVHDAPLTQIGFVRNGMKGASPDSLIGNDGGLEIKTSRADLLVNILIKGEMPPKHKAQVQGNLWVCEREWWDLVVYWPNMPLFVMRQRRDEAYIANLSGEVDRFNEELAQTVARIKAFA